MDYRLCNFDGLVCSAFFAFERQPPAPSVYGFNFNIKADEQLLPGSQFPCWCSSPLSYICFYSVSSVKSLGRRSGLCETTIDTGIRWSRQDQFRAIRRTVGPMYIVPLRHLVLTGSSWLIFFSPFTKLRQIYQLLKHLYVSQSEIHFYPARKNIIPVLAPLTPADNSVNAKEKIGQTHTGLTHICIFYLYFILTFVQLLAHKVILESRVDSMRLV